MAAAALEVANDVKDCLGLGHHKYVAHDLAQTQFYKRSGWETAGGLTWRSIDVGWCAGATAFNPPTFSGWTEEHEPREVFRVDHADDVFGAAGLIVNGNARMEQIDDPRAGFFDEHV